MRTAEHMEHRNLERKWRPSLVLGPHLTEGRLNDERKSCCVCVCVRVAAFTIAAFTGGFSCWCRPTQTAPRLCLLGAVRLHRPRYLKFKPVPIIEYNIASSATRECERGENDCRRFASIRFASEDG